MRDQTHVVAGILKDEHDRILLAQRTPRTHLAGTWEFPGGKVEIGESVEQALRRELHEELGIEVGAVEPLISVPWSYPGKSIALHAFRVLDFRGDPRGQQGQQVRWATPDQMARIAMPPADRPIVTALRLPREYAITPEPSGDDGPFLAKLESMARKGVSLLQLRSKQLPWPRLKVLAVAAHAVSKANGATLLLSGNLELVRELDLDGVHLPAAELMRLSARPLGRDRWVAASCHDERELAHAATIDIDFAVLGPALPTSSHSGAAPIGWDRFAALCATGPFPVYALGGMSSREMRAAIAAGAQGIAGISAFWPEE
jgi:8-oxo-dGTP diphosphatase